MNDLTQCPFFENNIRCTFKTNDNLEYINHKEEHEKRINEQDKKEFEEFCKNHPIDCNCKECLISDNVLMGFLKK